MIIYLITNKINNKQYIGQTIYTLEKRWRRHCWACTRKNCKMPITKAISKYGKDNFTISILESCSSIEILNEKEIYWVEKLNTMSPNGYNLRAGGGNRGIMAEETKLKISEVHKGKKLSAETIKKLSESHKGYKVKDETKQKLREINKGRKPTKFQIEKSIESSSKKYVIISPLGIILIIKNMAKFCRENKLSKSDMCELVRGKKNYYKGWTALYNIEDLESLAI